MQKHKARKPKDPKRALAARKAWITIRQKRAAAKAKAEAHTVTKYIRGQRPQKGTT